MKNTPILLIVEDDEGHAILMRHNFEAIGLNNPVEHFQDGQSVLDFLLRQGNGRMRVPHQKYLVLLDIRLPKVDGIEVLRQIKRHPELCKLPVIMLTTTDDSREVDLCHQLGCSVYLQKPVDSEKFAEAIRRLGMFIPLIQVPTVNGSDSLPPCDR